MPKSIAKSKRIEAERAAEWWLREKHRCLATRRTVRTKFQKVDFFGADVVGKGLNGSHYYVQVTAGKQDKVRERCLKIESIVQWHYSDSVFVVKLVEAEDLVNPRRKAWYFRVHEYELLSPEKGRKWKTWDEAVRIPTEWFKAWKETDNDQEKV